MPKVIKLEKHILVSKEVHHFVKHKSIDFPTMDAYLRKRLGVTGDEPNIMD